MKKAVQFIDANTSLPFKVVLPICIVIVSATTWIQTTLSAIQTMQKESVTRAELTIWRNALAERNKMVDVPYLDGKVRQ